MSQYSDQKIIVIGAGLSGLSCAEHLIKNGFDNVVVLEATDRVGGRICSVSLAELVQPGENSLQAELGAQHIHGIDRNPIYQIAEQNKLLQLRNCDNHFKNKSKVLAVTEDGVTVNPNNLKEVDWDFGMIIQKAEDFYHDQEPEPPWAGSVGQFLEKEFEKQHMTKISEPQRQQIHKLIFHQRVSRECYVSGCDSLSQVSLGEFGSYEELPGVHYVIPQGFEAVVDVIRAKIPDDKIYFKHAVKEVRWNSDERPRPVHIECDNGQVFDADHVIFTCSLGILKNQAHKLFSPGLPEEKLLAIEQLGFGSCDKVFLVFDEPVIDKEVKRVELLWDHSNIAKQDIATSWMKYIYAIDALSDVAIQLNIYGPASEYVERLTDEQLKQQLCTTLAVFLNKPVLPEPKRLIRTKWKLDEYTLGSYSFIATGSSVKSIETLAEPIISRTTSTPLIQFAGEATHKSFYSTSHGALLSGQREAIRLVSFYQGTPFEEVPEEDELDDGYQGFMF